MVVRPTGSSSGHVDPTDFYPSSIGKQIQQYMDTIAPFLQKILTRHWYSVNLCHMQNNVLNWTFVYSSLLYGI